MKGLLQTLEIKGWSGQKPAGVGSHSYFGSKGEGQIMRSSKGCNRKQRSQAEATWVRLIQTLQYKPSERTAATLCLPPVGGFSIDESQEEGEGKSEDLSLFS